MPILKRLKVCEITKIKLAIEQQYAILRVESGVEDASVSRPTPQKQTQPNRSKPKKYMAKIKQPIQSAPITPAAEVPEQPAPDLSLLIDNLSPLLAERKEGEEALAGNSLSIIIALREFRAENPGLERNDARLALQTAVAEKYGVKLTAVQNDKKPGEKGYSAYTLVSALLSAAWPKGEAEEKKVAKALAAGKGYVEVRKAASKPQSARNKDENARRITEENFAAKLSTFLTQAQVDMGVDMASILEKAEAVIEAAKAAPQS